jgi:mono/diheme cytochrome c family protein
VARPRGAGRALATAALFALASHPASASPQIDYMLHCQGCHLADGSGSPGGVPDLRNSIGRFVTVPGGRAYLVRVPGSASSALSDAALAGVLTWMVRRFGPAEVAAAFTPYIAEEVALQRAEPLLDVEGMRRTLLDRIDAAGAR